MDIYNEFSYIVSSLSLSALALCVYLTYKGLNNPEVKDSRAYGPGLTLPYLFYRGVELHPRLFGVDVKQWTNCRYKYGFSYLTLAI